MKAIKLTCWEYDNLENRDGRTLEYEKIFIAEGELSAFGKTAEFIAFQKPARRYLGNDGIIYPHYKIEDIEVN